MKIQEIERELLGREAKRVVCYQCRQQIDWALKTLFGLFGSDKEKVEVHADHEVCDALRGSPCGVHHPELYTTFGVACCLPIEHEGLHFHRDDSYYRCWG